MPNLLVTGREGDCFHFSLVLEDAAGAPEEAARLSGAAAVFLDEKKTEPFAANAIHTAIEELVTNLGKFGRGGPDAPAASEALKAEGEIRVGASGVELRLTDNGCAFDPTLLPDPVFPDNPEDLVPGGLGIHMLRNMFSSFRYRRAEGKNVAVWSIACGEKTRP